MKSRTTQLLFLLLGTLAAVQQGQAQPSREPTGPEARGIPRESLETEPRNGLVDAPAREENVAISRREASELAREEFEGRVLNMRLDRDQWRIRMDEDGTVFNVLVDAQSGKVSRPDE